MVATLKQKCECLERLMTLTLRFSEIVFGEAVIEDVENLERLIAKRQECMDEYSKLSEKEEHLRASYKQTAEQAKQEGELKEMERNLLERIIKQDVKNSNAYERHINHMIGAVKSAKVEARGVKAYSPVNDNDVYSVSFDKTY